MYDGSSRERIAQFRAQLERAHVPVTVRLTRGRDIEAACGHVVLPQHATSEEIVP
jgi:23S rRNA (adenine2503-C2)-methyltransferase